jgi:signal transduction histidine kinase/CHASE3 domain sensor protein/ActR/RegA family two-component response regulator
MQLRLNEKIPWAFALALLPLVIIVVASFRNMSALLEAAQLIRHTQDVKVSLGNLLAHVTDAQNGMRGFVITGNETFLEPYQNAAAIIDQDFADLQRLIGSNAEQGRRLDAVKSIVADQLDYLSRTVAVRRTDGFDAAQRRVLTEYGKKKMEAVRVMVSEMNNAESQLLQQRQVAMDAHTRDTRIVLGISALLGFVLAVSASVSISRELRKRRQVESELRQAYDDLDERIKQRTQELEDVNVVLRQEALERQRAQELLQQSDERLRHALTAGRLGTWEWEIATDRVTTYGHLLPLFGLADEQFTGKRGEFMGRMHDEDRPRVEQLLQQSIRGEVEYDTDFRVVWPDNSIHWLMAKGAVVKSDAGEPLHMIGVNMEITDLKNAQHERERLLLNEKDLRARAEAANRMKDEFLATVSHELRTPLNAILGWTTLLRKGRLDDRGIDKALETVERNARSQTKLIEDLLDISRITTGHLKLDVQSLDLPSVIHAALDSLHPAAEIRQIKLQALVDNAAGPVWGDPQRMQQIVWNLLSNAIKFTPKGGQVQVQLERVNSHVELAVSDTGQGISANFLPHVFERFEQEDASSKRKHGGLGIGLAIVRQLVELHGGQVTAESAGEGKGATFRVVLPIMLARRKSVHEDQRLAAPASVGARSEQHLLSGLRVLAVDDERDARELLAELLTANGVDVRVAASGVDALATLKQWRPDVLISDIGMPDMDGYELLRELRFKENKSKHTRLPALALTAYATAEDRMRALQSGFQMHIAKPVDPEELTTVLASLTGRLNP